MNPIRKAFERVKAAGHNFGMSRDTVDDLKAQGLLPSDGVKIVNDLIDEDTILVCVRFGPGLPQVMPDNLTGVCSYGCGHAIQFRPHAAAARMKICIECINAGALDKAQ